MKTTVALSLVAIGGAVCGAGIGVDRGHVVDSPFCEATPTRTDGRGIVRVRTVGALEDAIARASPGDTILVHDGEYPLRRMLDISAARVTLRGASGDASVVVLRGAGMDDREVGVALSISAPDVTVQDVTIGMVGFHAVQVRGERGASGFTLRRSHILDTGQQLIKGSTDGGPRFADRGQITCSLIEYSSHAPSDYTNGIDILAGEGWIVRDNVIRRVRGPEASRWSSGPAILFWANSKDTLVERNVIVDSFRGIAFGLGPRASGNLARGGESLYDHQGGWIRNNVIVNLNQWADEGIEVSSGRDVKIDHNTVLTLGSLPWSIGLRFPGTDGLVRNNLTSKPIALRDGGRGRLDNNVSDADPRWFVDAAGADLHVGPEGLAAIDRGMVIEEIREDFSGDSRASGRLPDAGAFESRAR